MRAETRRSDGEVAALMAPCSQTAKAVGTGVSGTGPDPDSMRTGPVGCCLFDAAALNTYTHLSLAFTSRTVPAPGHRERCGRLVETTKGRSSIGRALVSKTSGWGFKSLRPCYTLLRQDVCACTYFIAQPCGSTGRGTATTRNQVSSVTDAVGSIDMPDAEDEAPESKKKTRKGGKRGKKGPLGRLALFYRQIVAELRKVVWPTRSQLTTYTSVVIVFVVVMIGLVTVLDMGFARVVKYVFG